jgi:large subunit ribosomal protein L25
MAITLTASTGRSAGSRSSSRMRTDGLVPAVVYGLGRDSVAVSVPWPDLRRALKTEAGLNALITLDVDGQKDLAIIKDLQRHPIRRNVLHVDFLRVDPDAGVSVEVPLVLVGEAKKVEGRRGIVDQPLKSLTVTAKPADIPSFIEIDITDSITVATLTLPAGVTTDIEDSIQLVLGLATRFSVEDGATEGEAGEGAPAEGAAEGDAEGAAEGDAE